MTAVRGVILFGLRKKCDVTLFDLSPENVKFAVERANEQGLSIKVECGDAREADKLINGKFDHILLMGPMYHPFEESDRITAINAARTVRRAKFSNWVVAQGVWH